jgi:hypothetical protein
MLLVTVAFNDERLIENQIEQRKIGGKWVLTQSNNNNNEDNDIKIGNDKNTINLNVK